MPITGSFRDALVLGLNNGDETRATVLRLVSEQPDLGTDNFIDSEMVKAFIRSSEYRQRFGPN